MPAITTAVPQPRLVAVQFEKSLLLERSSTHAALGRCVGARCPHATGTGTRIVILKRTDE